jgi:hypothetical protein
MPRCLLFGTDAEHQWPRIAFIPVYSHCHRRQSMSNEDGSTQFATRAELEVVIDGGPVWQIREALPYGNDACLGHCCSHQLHRSQERAELSPRHPLISTYVSKIVGSRSEITDVNRGVGKMEGCLIGTERAEGEERRVNKLSLVHSIDCHTCLINGGEEQEQSEDARQREQGWMNSRSPSAEVRCQRERKRWNR